MNPNVLNSLKVDLRKQQSKCPNLHSYPYMLGNLCCRDKVESYDCKTCPSNDYVKCPNPPCGPSDLLEVQNDISSAASSVVNNAEEIVSDALDDLNNL